MNFSFTNVSICQESKKEVKNFMSQVTKMKLADALEQILQNTSISKVTVLDIVNISGVSRQTFYNNFIDIYDLVYWTHMVRTKEAIDTFWENEDFCQSFEMSIIIMREHKIFYQQIIRKEGVNSFQRLFAQQNIELSKVRIKNVSDRKIDKKIEFLLELYWYGTAQMLVNWIENGMKEKPKELAQLFYEGLPLSLRHYWSK